MSVLDPATVPADDRALLLGDGLFETVRLYRGRPFRLERHLDRLVRGAEVVGIPVPGAMRAQVASLVDRWGDRDGALRITLTRGSAPGLAASPESVARLLLWVRPLGSGAPAPGFALRAWIRGRLDERSLTAGLKCLGFLERIQALRLANAAGGDEALLRNSSELLVEGTASNLLAVKGGTLIAPGPESGALPGITREVLLEAARGSGVRVEERGVAADEIPDVSELLLSSSLREVVPLIELEGRKIGAGRPGPVFAQLAASLREAVRAETGGRVRRGEP